jgi:hypothetical protein
MGATMPKDGCQRIKGERTKNEKREADLSAARVTEIASTMGGAVPPFAACKKHCKLVAEI